MKRLFFVLLIAALIAGCNLKDLPTEFPTPPPIGPATPLEKMTLKPDAELEKQIAKIAEAAKGKVGVAALLLETGDAATLNGDQRFPMQSVYKLPISMAVMDQIRRGELDLDEKIGVTKEDMVAEGQRSPLRDANPNGGEFTIRELIRLAIVESDGTASDVLMRIAGGAPQIQNFLTQIGVKNMRVANTEKELAPDWQTQYQNYSTPADAIELLRWLQTSTANAKKIDDNEGGDKLAEDKANDEIVMWFMAGSNPGARRLKGLLPAGTVVAHETGTGGTQNGITGATNDIGIIYLPNGKHIAIAVFVSDSPAGQDLREAVIAKVAKAVWDRWN
ncbi:MAG: class A beta-lactamase [Pyrinomonadaceae bacterium]